MAWVRLSDEWLADERVRIDLPRDARLLHLEFVAFSNRNDLEGFIADDYVRAVGDSPDRESAIGILVARGYWERVEGGYRLIALMDQQLSAEETRRRRQNGQRRQERHRKHLSGDHSLCDSERCSALRRDASRNASRNASTTHSLSRPDPTRPEGKGREEYGDDDGPVGGTVASPQEECAHGFSPRLRERCPQCRQDAA